jgi:transcriptional regulator with XRE-family HTH domain
LLRLHIAQSLLKLREAAGLERKEIVELLGCSLGHVRHLETMVSLPKPLEVRALLERYGVPDRVPSFLGLVKAAGEGRDWWEDFPGRPSWLELLLSGESAAAGIDSWDTIAVTGLFHTPAYAEDIIRTGEPELPDDEVRHRIELRMARQDALTRQPNPPRVRCVMDEAVLHHMTADPSVLAEQLVHLVKLSELPNVTIQVARFNSGAWLHGVSGTFTVLTLGPEFVDDPGFVYTESAVSGDYIRDQAEIEYCRTTFDRVQRKACSPEESRAILAQRAEEIRR